MSNLIDEYGVVTDERVQKMVVLVAATVVRALLPLLDKYSLRDLYVLRREIVQTLDLELGVYMIKRQYDQRRKY